MSQIKSGSTGNSAKKWVRQGLVLVPLAAILVALLIIHPWGSRIGIGATLSRVQAAMTGIQSYRATFFSTNDQADQTSAMRIEVEYSSPDRFHYIRLQTGSDQALEYIIVADKQYIKDGGVNTLDLPDMSNPISLLLTKEAALKYLEILTNVEQLPEDTIDGISCLHYRGIYDIGKILLSQQGDRPKAGLPPLTQGEIAKQVALARLSGVSTVIELWIGKDDYLIRQIKGETQSIGSDGQTISSVATSKFYDFNSPISIEPPLDASGNLLPGWTSSTPEQPALSKDMQATIDNSDPANRRINYIVSLTNISSQTLSQLNASVRQMSDNSGVYVNKISTPPNYAMNSLDPGATLKYEIAFGYDATTIKPETAVSSIQNSSLLIRYLTPDGRQQLETAHFEVPVSIYSLPTDLPPFRNLIPVGEYKIDEAGATSAGPGISAEIAGKRYLFVQVQTQNFSEYTAPGVLILNIENPARPVKVAYLKSPENTRYLGMPTLYGTTLFVTADNYLWIIDVSHPEAPQELTQLSGVLPGPLVFSGKYAYFGDGNTKISTLDISDPAHPQVIGSLPLDSRSGMKFEIIGNYLLVWAGSTLYTVDISVPASLKIVNSYAFNLPMANTGISPAPRISPAYVLGDSIRGSYAYAALGINGRTGLSVIDISDPAKPYEIGFLELKDRSIWGSLFVSGNRLYLDTQSNSGIIRKSGVDFVDISDPSTPLSLGFGNLPDAWNFFTNVGNSSSLSDTMVDRYFYWFVGYELNPPVIEVFDLSGP